MRNLSAIGFWTVVDQDFRTRELAYDSVAADWHLGKFPTELRIRLIKIAVAYNDFARFFEKILPGFPSRPRPMASALGWRALRALWLMPCAENPGRCPGMFSYATSSPAAAKLRRFGSNSSAINARS